jgi:sugar lactone lactonase YvrE
MSTPRVLASGLHFGEGPRWHHGTLWFSDFYDHAVKTVDMDGQVEVKVDVPGQPSGLGWLPGGQLLIVSMLERTLLRLEEHRLVVHADLSDVATFHCNDMVVDAKGRAYVGNFGFDLDGDVSARGFGAVMRDHPLATLAMVAPDGTVSAAATDLDFPNGTVITPDGTTMIIAETLGQRLTAFTIADDGSLADRRVFAEVPRRAPDGICLDADGAVWFADAMTNECVRVADGGKVLEVVQTDQPCYACMLGGPDGCSLFMLTASASASAVASTRRTGKVLVTTVDVPHAGLP